MSKKLVKQVVRKPWIMNGPNSILEGEEFLISFNLYTGDGHGEYTVLANTLGADVEDGTETALVIYTKPHKTYKILTGDFRDEYEKRHPSLEACLGFFDSMKKEHGNNWSTLEEDRP